jgi:diaminohydroxyphosphoribosylaminopyrimidine deaminase/5-amino-6-(5-phosphoribosylamino)uracil reductase
VDFRERARELADRAIGRTSPNPPVGAVLVRDGKIVGEGYTQPPGSAHAEVVALGQAGARADGAEMYVTLEPCCHHGRTPPCTDALVAAGVRRVYVAAIDPFPAVNGGGVAALRRAEIEVTVDPPDDAIDRLNRPFFHYVRAGRPFVTAKWAMTLDGKIATHTGDSRWVSGEESRRLVHQERDRSDAIVVGSGTALADDPSLTVRLDPGDVARPPRLVPPWRVVIDTRARTRPDGNLLRIGDGRALIIVGAGAPDERVAALREAGADVVVVPQRGGHVDLDAALAELARRGVVRLLLEGGGELCAAFFARGYVDRVLAFVAPKLVGGKDAPSPVGGSGLERVADAWQLEDVTWRPVGRDLVIEGYVGGACQRGVQSAGLAR